MTSRPVLKLLMGGADTTPVNWGPGMINEFVEHQRMCGFKPTTIRRRRWTLTKFAETVPLTDATLRDVERFVAARPSPASRRAILSDLKMFYVWATERDLVDHNPTERAARVKVPKRMPRPLSSHDIDRAITSSKGTLRAIVMLGAYAGLRVSEIAALRWDDIDTTHRVIEIRDGKGGKDRSVPLAPELAAQLDALPRRADGKVIGTTGGNVSQRVRNLFTRLGIDHRPHDLRAAFATHALVASGGNVVLVQRLMGHGSVQTTMSYLAWHPDGRDVIDRLYGDGEAA